MPRGNPTEKKTQNKVYEVKLLKSVSKTHSVFALLLAFGFDILVYVLIYIGGFKKEDPQLLIPAIVALVIKDIWSAIRDERRFGEVIRTLRDDEKSLVLADPTRLPPWVHYPDVERCSWLNQLLIHFWPYIGRTVTEKIHTQVFHKRMSGLKLKRVSLGSVPPRISGVKVYDKKVSDNHLIIDANLCYSGDCEFSISYWGIPGGIENFQLHGPARINLLIVQNPPFIGGVEFSFLGLPQIDFVLTGVGSLGFTEETLRSMINLKISSLAVFPNKVGQVWGKGREESIQDPKGVIRVNVIEAKNLTVEGLWDRLSRGKSDPYAAVSYGSKTFWSRVIDNCHEPHWDLWCEFVKGKDKVVSIKVMDKDISTTDDLIGTYNLRLSDLEKKGKLEDSWVKINEKNKNKGSIRIRAFFLQVSPDLNDVQFPPEEFSFLSSYVLIVHVKSAHNLAVPRRDKKPNPTVKLNVGNDTQKTKKVMKNSNPVYNEHFTLFVNNPEFNKLKVNVVDDEDESNTKEEEDKNRIGSFSYSLKKLLDRKNLEIVDQHFPLLDSASESTVVLSVRLRVIKNTFQ